MEKFSTTTILLILSVILSACSQNIVVQDSIENIKEDRMFMEAIIGLQNDGEQKVDTSNETVTIITQVEQFLYEQVPELSDYEDYILSQSLGEANLIIRIYPTLTEVFKDGPDSEYLGQYYAVYVGENWADHSVRWDSFYVSENFDKVLWEDIIRAKGSDFDMYTLEEWRSSSHYREWLINYRGIYISKSEK